MLLNGASALVGEDLAQAASRPRAEVDGKGIRYDLWQRDRPVGSLRLQGTQYDALPADTYELAINANGSA